ncbi:Hypothetical predicted protein [Lecanosticta acicola]|uniref:Uncharacterized protein n=1 Tax=Lecanosticta acicola TaxID=111012 RepID=A0AAI8YS58_9PEZI|nr:Hypothetical predicted protein [Lecanosticta acicola]
MANCTVHLIKLTSAPNPKDFIRKLKPSSALIKGIPYGWVHKPRSLHTNELLGSKWDLFLLTESNISMDPFQAAIETHITIPVTIPPEQFETLKQQITTTPAPSQKTPPLPTHWTSPQSHIPQEELVETRSTPLSVGELRLDNPMAEFLSNALPQDHRDRPACFFNLFKYKNDDRSTHDSYMQGFKNTFGDAAGASVKFMGPVRDVGNAWDDANLVQYDSVWHYAYMLSTDVYKELNKEKVAGLEDTCILLVGETEPAGGK